MSRREASGAHAAQGQALVEFSLAILVFMMVVLGIVDLGRAIYAYNGVAEASREVARAASVHPFAVGSTSLGGSSQVASTIATQQSLVPGLTFATATCLDIAGAAITSRACTSGDSVQVTASAPFSTVTPLLSFFGPFTLRASSTVKLQ